MNQQMSEAVALLESEGAIVILPGRARQTREGLHKALDALVAMHIGASPLGTSLRKTSVMELMEWSFAHLNADAGVGV